MIDENAANEAFAACGLVAFESFIHRIPPEFSTSSIRWCQGAKFLNPSAIESTLTPQLRANAMAAKALATL